MHHQKIKIAMLYMLTGISDCCFVCYGAKKVLNLYNFIFFIWASNLMTILLAYLSRNAYVWFWKSCKRLNFLFLPLCVNLFKNSPSQGISFLPLVPFKSKSKNPIHVGMYIFRSIFAGNSNFHKFSQIFSVYWELYIDTFDTVSDRLKLEMNTCEISAEVKFGSRMVLVSL